MKILVIHTAFIGDIVLSTPLIQRLKEMYPKSEIDYLTLPANKSVISNNPNLNEIILYDKKGKDKGIKGFLRVLKILKQKKELVLTMVLMLERLKLKKNLKKSYKN